MKGFAHELAAYRADLRRTGLGEFADPLADAALASIRLLPQADRTARMPGGTRLGGQPDLPAATPWPSCGGTPLSFVAQVNLAEVHEYDAQSALPADGLLSFFYDNVTQPWGFDPADRGRFAVVFTPREAPLEHRPSPEALAAADVFAEVTLAPSPELTFVPGASSAASSLGLSRDQLLEYRDLPTRPEDHSIHRLLGHPDPIQGDMQLECQLAANGLSDGGGKRNKRDTRRAAALAGDATDWLLLAQFDSEDDAGMTWGDAGRLYYWIRGQDLAARSWASVWVILQCT